jgi:DNA-3-methyladenine glycosylase
MEILERSFYSRDTVVVAQELIGKIIVRADGLRMMSGRIVETEAYGGADDPASHAYRKKTERNKAMFQDVGHAYIYFIYGMHFNLNIVARDHHAQAGGVLIRAIEPLEGLDHMRELRGQQDVYALASGPGKVAQAYGITKKLYGCDVTKKGELYVMADEYVPHIAATSRIGIRVGQEKVWRFLDSGTDFVSRGRVGKNAAG